MSWLLLALCLAADVTQIPFEYPGFTRHENLQTAGSTQFAGPALRLTKAMEQQAGAAWYVNKEPVTGGFDTTFKFQLTKQGGLGDGADGLAFVLQNSGTAAIAGRGSSGGFGFGDGQHNKRAKGIPRAIAIFFDTHQNREDHDPSDNYVGIFNNGAPGKMHWPAHRLAYNADLAVTLKDGEIHTARILYRSYLSTSTTPIVPSSSRRWTSP